MEILLKYTDPTGYQTEAAPGAISWLGGGGGWGERGMDFGGSVNWDYFVPNTSWHQYYGNYAYDTYNWSTEYYEHHTLEGVGTISYDQVYAHDLLPYANELYFGAAAVQKYKEEKKAYMKRQKQILEELQSTAAFLNDFNNVIAGAESYGMMFDGPDDPPGGGDFSLAGMYLHFQVGGGAMTINMASIDFSGTSQRVLGLAGMKPGDIRKVNLFKAGLFFRLLWLLVMYV